MKLSNKILLSVFGLVVIFILSILIKVRVDIGEVKAAGKVDPATRDIAIPPFNSITLSANAYVFLQSGSDYEITITGATKEDINLNFDAQVIEGNLELNLPDEQEMKHLRPQIRITTPMVKKIILNNEAGINIENLSQDSLEIRLSQMANLVARQLTVDQLIVHATGKTRLRSQYSTIKEVIVNLDNQSDCSLFNLDGTSITGQVRAKASLRLSGWTEKLSVDMDEDAKVIKRN